MTSNFAATLGAPNPCRADPYDLVKQVAQTTLTAGPGAVVTQLGYNNYVVSATGTGMTLAATLPIVLSSTPTTTTIGLEAPANTLYVASNIANLAAKKPSKRSRTQATIGYYFESISAALASLPTTGPTNFTVIYVYPGTYTETNIILLPNVAIKGIDREAVVVNVTGATTMLTSSTAPTVVLNLTWNTPYISVSTSGSIGIINTTLTLTSTSLSAIDVGTELFLERDIIQVISGQTLTLGASGASGATPTATVAHVDFGGKIVWNASGAASLLAGDIRDSRFGLGTTSFLTVNGVGGLVPWSIVNSTMDADFTLTASAQTLPYPVVNNVHFSSTVISTFLVAAYVTNSRFDNPAAGAIAWGNATIATVGTIWNSIFNQGALSGGTAVGTTLNTNGYYGTVTSASPSPATYSYPIAFPTSAVIVASVSPNASNGAPIGFNAGILSVSNTQTQIVYNTVPTGGIIVHVQSLQPDTN